MLETIEVSSDHLPEQPTQRLDHLPGLKGHWLFGNVRELMPNPLPSLLQASNQLGNCFTVGFLRNKRVVILSGPAANELVLLDRNNNLSSRLGWDVVGPFFGRNILVRDFADHRAHRKLMNQVFKPQSLASYLGQINTIIDTSMHQFHGQVDVYRQTKQLALDIAIDVFAGIPPTRSAVWNRDLSEVLSNVMAQRIPIPFSRYWYAKRARDRLRNRLADEVTKRRGNTGQDLLSKLANQKEEQGFALSDQDVIDHLFGLLFAAHDTTASSLAMISWLLTQHQDWQSAARAECSALYQKTGSLELNYADLAALPVIEAIFFETLRLYAPVQFIPRRCVEAFEFAGHNIPANTHILLTPQVTHYDSSLYPEPERFNPQRFLEDTTNKPPFIFVPFGKGSHMCLGMHFAHMEIKAVLYRVLLTKSLEQVAGNDATLEYLPIVRPVKPLYVEFSELDTNATSAGQ